MSPSDSRYLVVGNSSDDPFALDVAFAMGQQEDVSDLISMKLFANSEFCPRFISDENDYNDIGGKLRGKGVIIVSNSNLSMSRQSLAMRSMMIARAAKENGAEEVVLVEPDLYFSAQDRGPRPDLGDTDFQRDSHDLKKFDGQPFTAKLYAEMLNIAGVDRVVTVHNHSHSVQSTFEAVFDGRFHNLIPYEIYVDYLLNSDIVQYGPAGTGLTLCAPDKGARDFVKEMFRLLGLPKANFILLDKERKDEREVAIALHPESESTFEQIQGHDLVLFDDMVRTGSTVVRACQFLKRAHLGKTVFALTHFYASDEGRVKMADTSIDEILTLNTIPTILNRDVQGRLRRKLVVLKIERWLAKKLGEILNVPTPDLGNSLYQIDMSSKNSRWKRKIWLSEQLKTLHADDSRLPD